MAMILRKMFGSMVNRSNSTSSRSSVEIPVENSSMGALDQLPTDLIMQVLRIVGPKNAAKLGTVCRALKYLVSDNKLWIYFLQNGKELWELVLFAETHLRSGFLSTICFNSQLSFMDIYAQRENVPGSIIIDGGSGYCKYGWSKYSSPSGRCATLMEFGNIESPIHSRLRYFFSTIYNRMQVKPSFHPIIVSVPICHSDDTESARASRRQLRDAIHTVLFDMNVPAICAIDQAVLALYAARRTSGIVVNVGFSVTSVVPILRGKVMREVGVEIVGLGALKLTGYLKQLMQQRSISFESFYTVRTIKEKLCYVATDYEAELRKDTQASCEVPGEGWFTLSNERFQTAELLFRPQIAGVQALGLHKAIGLCMDHCAAAEVASDDGWYKTVVLAGGTACLPGLPERLEKELHQFLTPSVAEGVKVLPPPFGVDTAWFGAKIVGNVSTFTDAWCITKKQFRQNLRRNKLPFGSWE